MHIQKIQHDSAGEIFESGERRQKPRLEDTIRLGVGIMQCRASLLHSSNSTQALLHHLRLRDL
jgi:hypothetical protein